MTFFFFFLRLEIMSFESVETHINFDKGDKFASHWDDGAFSKSPSRTVLLWRFDKIATCLYIFSQNPHTHPLLQVFLCFV